MKEYFGLALSYLHSPTGGLVERKKEREQRVYVKV